MAFRFSDGQDAQRSAPGGNGSKSRREFIYPHRAVRFIGQKNQRLWVGLAVAAILTTLMVVLIRPLLVFHADLIHLLMDLAGVPGEAWANIYLWPHLGPAPAPVTYIPTFQELTDGPRILVILAVVALLLVSRKLTLLRGFVGFLIILLIAGILLCVLYPDFHFNSLAFAQMWYRNEVLVWLLLPWMSSSLLVIFQPRIVTGILLVILAQIYELVFAALRYVFFLGMLHYTGMLFFSVLWFGLGLLSTLLFLLLFYSLQIHWTSGRIWGLRQT